MENVLGPFHRDHSTWRPARCPTQEFVGNPYPGPGEPAGHTAAPRRRRRRPFHTRTTHTHTQNNNNIRFAATVNQRHKRDSSFRAGCRAITEVSE